MKVVILPLWIRARATRYLIEREITEPAKEIRLRSETVRTTIRF